MTDLTPNDLSHLSDAEFHALCPQGEHAPGPEPLSPAAQATTDFRALCAELAAELDHNRRCLLDDRRLTHPLADRARAALAEPVADGPAVLASREPAAVARQPSDEELRDLWSWAAGQDQGPWPTQYHCFARAVLARWGQPPAPPAEGEVAELVDDLRITADAIENQGYPQTAAQLRRAAELLERHAAPVSVAEPPSDEELRDIWETGHLPSSEELANDDGEQDLQFLFTSAYYRWLEENPDAMEEHENKCIRAVFNAGQRWSSTISPAERHPAPIPVSQRHPRADECDDRGRCWWFDPHNGGSWTYGSFWRTCSHWLPAGALPRPGVQP